MGDLREAFDRTALANQQLIGDLDSALVAVGRKIADRVDGATEGGDDQEVTKALYLTPHLMNILREMYATPKARHEAGLSAKGGAPSGNGNGALGKLQGLKGGKVS